MALRDSYTLSDLALCPICAVVTELDGKPIGVVSWALSDLHLSGHQRCQCGVAIGMHAIMHPHRMYNQACMGYNTVAEVSESGV